MNTQAAVIAIVGWKNSGKTTLVNKLVEALVARGLTVSTLKHAHHQFDVDQPGSDTHRHRMAGAREVAIVSGKRWSIMHENAPNEEEPALEAVLSRLSPCDIVVLEGYKASNVTKIEVQRQGAKQHDPLYARDENVIAIVNPLAKPPDHLPSFEDTEIEQLTDFVIKKLGVKAETKN